MRWIDLWTVGIVDLGLSEARFWDLTPREFRALADRRLELERAEDLRFGELATLVASLGGAKKSNGLPFGPADFFPSLAVPRFFDPTVQVADRPDNLVDLPKRPGQNAVEDGWDRWVEMCRMADQHRARAR